MNYSFNLLISLHSDISGRGNRDTARERCQQRVAGGTFLQWPRFHQNNKGSWSNRRNAENHADSRSQRWPKIHFRDQDPAMMSNNPMISASETSAHAQKTRLEPELTAFISALSIIYSAFKLNLTCNCNT